MKSVFLIITAFSLLASHLRADEVNNLIPNGNFDSPGGGWEIAYREPELGVVTFETDAAPADIGFVRLAPLNSSMTRALALQNPMSEVGPGNYKLKAWMRVSEDYAARMPRVSVGWKMTGDHGESGSESLAIPEEVEPEKWVLYEKDFQIPEGAVGTYVFLFVYGSVGHVDFDGVSLETLP